MEETEGWFKTARSWFEDWMRSEALRVMLGQRGASGEGEGDI